MANYRKTSVLAEESASTAATKTIDITLKKIISRLQIRFNSTNNGHDMTAVHATAISKVELVNGSDVLWSLNGKQIEAKMFYDNPIPPSYERETRNDVENYLTLDLMFGRRLFDPELALDPTHYPSLQLKITHNKALGGSAPDAATLAVFADIFDEKAVSPGGFLSPLDYHDFTSASSAAYEYINLPTDHPLRRIYLQTILADSWWENLISNLEIDAEGGTQSLLDLTGQELVSLIMTRYPYYRELIAATMSGTGPNTYYVTPHECSYWAIAIIGPSASTFCGPDAEYVGGYAKLVSDQAIGFKAEVKGYIPHGVVPLDFGDPNVIDDWWDVTRVGSPRIIPYAGGSAPVNVILEQLRRY